MIKPIDKANSLSKEFSELGEGEKYYAEEKNIEIMLNLHRKYALNDNI